MTEGPYNPLDTINLGKSVVEALLDKTPDLLGSIPSFNGAGIYVIYYKGEFKPYLKLAHADQPGWPIYIGKAIPSGGRKGASPDGAKNNHGRKLPSDAFERLNPAGQAV